MYRIFICNIGRRGRTHLAREGERRERGERGEGFLTSPHLPLSLTDLPFFFYKLKDDIEFRCFVVYDSL